MKNNLSPSEIDLILAHILKKSREFVLAHPDFPLTEAQKRQFEKMKNRRKNHEPMAYILGHKEFYGLDFKVDRHTLIPRPETEMLVEEAISNLKLVIRKKDTKTAIIDIGTGSGNIIVSIAKELEKISSLPITIYELLATDISQKALRVAKYNAKKHKVEKRIKFIKSDLLESKKIISNLTKKQFGNLIFIANLPYLSKKIYSEALPNVKNFEPKSALLSGHDGLDHYKKLFRQITALKTTSYNLKAILEISPEQKTKIGNLAKKYFPRCKTSFQKDLAGKWRMAIIKLQR